MDDIAFKIIEYGSAEYKAATILREDYLLKPLGSNLDIAGLVQEKDYTHIIGIRAEEIIATAVLVPKGEACRIQSVTVKGLYQSKGVGKKIMLFCEEYANQQGFKEIYCKVRDVVFAFYLNHKYIPEGDYFTFPDNDFRHIKMRKKL